MYPTLHIYIYTCNKFASTDCQNHQTDVTNRDLELLIRGIGLCNLRSRIINRDLELLIRGIGLCNLRSRIINRGNELVIRGIGLCNSRSRIINRENELIIRGNGLCNSRSQINFYFFEKSTCPFMAFVLDTSVLFYNIFYLDFD